MTNKLILNEKIAQKIDDSNFHFDLSISDCLKHLNKKGIYETDKLITLNPKIFIEDAIIYDEFDEHQDEEHSLNIVLNKCRLSIKIKSLVTEKTFSYEEEDIRLRTPYPNKRYVVAGTVVDRKFYQGVSFVPRASEFTTFQDSSMRHIFDFNSFKEEQGKAVLYTHHLSKCEQVEFNSSTSKKLYDSLSISKGMDRYTDHESNSRERYDTFLNHKYEIAPYEICEKWILCFELDGEELYTKELSVTNTVYFLKYQMEYIKQFEATPPICNIATYGCDNTGNIRLTKFGTVLSERAVTKVLIEAYPRYGCKFLEYDYPPELKPNTIGELIASPTVRVVPHPKRYTERYHYKVDVNKTIMYNRKPRIVTMIPIFE